MNNEYFHKKYIDLTYLIQNEFDRNIEKYGDKIKCRKGCSQCCSQVFRITVLDADIIKKYLNGIPLEEKFYLKEKARQYLEKKSGENLKSKLQCPALNDKGECMIYEARPVVCRRFGPPVFDYKNPGQIHACELNFETGEEIADEELIPNQTLIGIEWDKLKTFFNEENNLSENAPATIAGAIFES